MIAREITMGDVLKNCDSNILAINCSADQDEYMVFESRVSKKGFSGRSKKRETV